MAPRPRLRASAVALAAVLTVLASAGCSSTPDAPGAPDARGAADKPGKAAQAAQLAGTLDSPVDVTLRWTEDEPGVAGRTVEFATEKAGPYTVLEFVPPGRTTYRHPDLMPRTPFYYRLRPYVGPASAPVEVSLPPGEPSEKELTGNEKWMTPRTAKGPRVRRP